MFTLSTKTEPAALLSPLQQLTLCHRHLGWDPKPRSEVPASIDINSCSIIIRGTQGSISSYCLLRASKAIQSQAGSNTTPFHPPTLAPKSRNPGLTEYYDVHLFLYIQWEVLSTSAFFVPFNVNHQTRLCSTTIKIPSKLNKKTPNTK